MGYFRLSLALLVCANHLWSVYAVGRYAVFSFYIISGYLMASVTYEKYGTTCRGYFLYVANRMLRIYPIYFIVLIFSVITLFILKEHNTVQFDPNLFIPNSVSSWFMNISLIGLDFNVLHRTVPQAWTLFIEITFYLIIPLAIRAGKATVLLWLAISVAYHVYLLVYPVNPEPWSAWFARYGDVFSGSLGFALGCSIRVFHLRALINKTSLKISILGLLFIYGIVCYRMLVDTTIINNEWLSTYLYYASMFFTCVFVANTAKNKPSRTDLFIGKFSYPVYLTHLIAGFIIYSSFNVDKSFILFIYGTVLSILISIILIKIESMIDRKRSIITKKAIKQGE